jgi:N-acetylneuraminic acid mutarotase/acyl-CoA-binding protein
MPVPKTSGETTMTTMTSTSKSSATVGREIMHAVETSNEGHVGDWMRQRPLFDEDKALLLDALERQASAGPCVGSRPWEIWDPSGALAYDAWAMLGDMSPERAMEIYCEIVSSEYENWYDILVENMNDKQRKAMIATAKECALEYYRALASGALGETAKQASKSHQRVLTFRSNSSAAFFEELFKNAADDEFAPLPLMDNVSPKQRAWHLSSVVDDKLFISHGRAISNSRLLGDLWSFDFATGTWQQRGLKWPGSLCSGAASATVGSVMYAFRGKTTDDCDSAVTYNMTVSCMNLAEDYAATSDSFVWKHVQCMTTSERGEMPRAKASHTATTVGDAILIFGGVDSKSGDDSNELWAFDPSNSTWKKLTSATRARSSHSAACWNNRYLVVCGGSSGNEIITSADIDVYDTETDTWSTIEAVGDAQPCARASHASAIVGDHLFVIGGGNHECALQDAYTLNIRASINDSRASWTKYIDDCSLLGREGMSACVVSSSSAKYLLCHGGFSGSAQTSSQTICCRLSHSFL